MVCINLSFIVLFLATIKGVDAKHSGVDRRLDLVSNCPDDIRPSKGSVVVDIQDERKTFIVMLEDLQSNFEYQLGQSEENFSIKRYKHDCLDKTRCYRIKILHSNKEDHRYRPEPNVARASIAYNGVEIMSGLIGRYLLSPYFGDGCDCTNPKIIRIVSDDYYDGYYFIPRKSRLEWQLKEFDETLWKAGESDGVEGTFHDVSYSVCFEKCYAIDISDVWNIYRVFFDNDLSPPGIFGFGVLIFGESCPTSKLTQPPSLSPSTPLPSVQAPSDGCSISARITCIIPDTGEVCENMFVKFGECSEETPVLYNFQFCNREPDSFVDLYQERVVARIESIEVQALNKSNMEAGECRELEVTRSVNTCKPFFSASLKVAGLRNGVKNDFCYAYDFLRVYPRKIDVSSSPTGVEIVSPSGSPVDTSMPSLPLKSNSPSISEQEYLHFIGHKEDGYRYFPRLEYLLKKESNLQRAPTSSFSWTGKLHRRNAKCGSQLCIDGFPRSRKIHRSVTFPLVNIDRVENRFLMKELRGSGWPLGVYVEDRDGDGYLDIITVSNDGYEIFKNEKGGSFSSESLVRFSLDLKFHNLVEFADFDGDQRSDFAFIDCGETDSYGECISYSLRITLIAQNSHARLGLRGDCTAITTGDINGDGKIDIILGYHDGKIEIYQNDDGKNFSKIKEFSTADTAIEDLAAAPLNQDSYDDIVVVVNGGENHVIYNFDSGAFNITKLPSSYDKPKYSSIAVGDMDGDGLLDVVGVGTSQEILFNSGDNFSEAIPLLGLRASEATTVLGDIDGNGLIDILLVFPRRSCQIIFNKKDRSFTQAFDFPNYFLEDAKIALGDFDNDGSLDLFSAIGVPKNMRLVGSQHIFFNRSYGSLVYSSRLKDVQESPTFLLLEDFDDDGFLDLVIGTRSGRNRIAFNARDGSFQNLQYLPSLQPSENAFSMASADFDNDGFLDILICNSYSPSYILLSTQNDTFANESSTRNEMFAIGFTFQTHSWTNPHVAIGDLDQDGDIDIVIGEEKILFSGSDFEGFVHILKNDRYGNFNKIPLELYNGVSVTAVMVEEFNSNKHPEIILAHSNPDAQGDEGPFSIEIFRDSGHGVFECYDRVHLGERKCFEQLDGDAFCEKCSYITDLAIGDLDGDGKQDLAVSVWGGDDRVIFDFRSDFRRTVLFENQKYEYSETVTIEDMNSDGMLDLIFGSGTSYTAYGERKSQDGSDNYIILNRGDGTFYDPMNIPESTSWETTSISVGRLTSEGPIHVLFAVEDVGIMLYNFVHCVEGGAKLHTRSWCFQCPSFMGLDESTQQCVECSPDHIQQRNSQFCSNVPCPFGGRPSGDDGCQTCSDGTYYNRKLTNFYTDISERCVPCPSGSYANNAMIPAVDQCFKCSPGTFQDETNAVECKKCPHGQFQPALGATKCEICEKGGYCPLEDVASFNGGYLSCPDGTFSDELRASSNSTCKPCQKGTFWRGSNGTKGTEKCLECPYPLSSFENASMCSICREGFYLNSTKVNVAELNKRPTEYCIPCPDHENKKTTCARNTTITNIAISPGYWRDSVHTATIYKCDKGSSCNHINNITDYCAEGHQGPLCKVCSENGFYFSQAKGRCEKCHPLWRLILHILLAVFVFGLFTTIFFKIVRKSTSFAQVVLSFNLQTKLKILVGFYQVVSVLTTVYGVQFHSDFRAWFHISRILSLEFFKILSFPKSCLGETTTIYLMGAIWPFLLYAMIVCTFGFIKVFRISLSKFCTAEFGCCYKEYKIYHRQRLMFLLIQVAIVVFYFSMPVVSQSIFDAKKCIAFQTDDAEGSEGIASYLIAHLNITCNSTSHTYNSLQTMFWVFFGIWLITMPLCFTVLVTFIKDSVQIHQPTQLALGSRFLWQDFNEDSKIGVYWDVIETLRKIFLTGFINFIDERDGSKKILRLSIAAIITVLYIIIVIYARPYKRNDDLQLSIFSNTFLMLCFIMGIALQLCGDDHDEMCVSFVSSSLTSRRASIVVISLTLTLPIVTLVMLVFLTYKAPIARLKSTGYPPNLELPPSCTHHIFLSHCWAGGQSATHAIAQKLKLFMPSLHVWLDVDDLHDVDDLETCVETSAVVLIFYCDGYFRSKNCRREFFQALECQKPIIVVYDGSEIPSKNAFCSNVAETFNLHAVEDWWETQGGREIRKCPAVRSINVSEEDEVTELVTTEKIHDVFKYRENEIILMQVVNECYEYCTLETMTDWWEGRKQTSDDVESSNEDQHLIGTEQEEKDMETVGKQHIPECVHKFINSFVDVEDNDDNLIQWIGSGDFSLESSKLIYSRLLRHLPYYNSSNLNHYTLLDEGMIIPGSDPSAKVSLPSKFSGVEVLIFKGNCNGSHFFLEDFKDHVSKQELAFQLQEEDKATSNAQCSVSSSAHFLPTYHLTRTPSRSWLRSRSREASDISHKVLLFYLNESTFASEDDTIFEQLESFLEMKDSRVSIVLVHEQDTSRGFCEFGTFFGQVPQKLIDPPHRIFKEIAIPLYTRPEYREVSLKMILNKIVSANIP